jgi:hypothetical protein
VGRSDVASHRYGGIEFRVGRRELGHLHGSRLADLPFPMKVRNELIASGRAEAHHILPDSGWVSRWIRGAPDADAVIELFRMNYERSWLARSPHGLESQPKLAESERRLERATGIEPVF